jgi:murein DD-endopeptidase MepM/ murein hydrolase activator NlpD
MIRSRFRRLALVGLCASAMVVTASPAAFGHVHPTARLHQVVSTRERLARLLERLESRIARRSGAAKVVARAIRASDHLIDVVEPRAFIVWSRELVALRTRIALLERRARGWRATIAGHDTEIAALREQLSHLFQVCPVHPATFVDDFGVVSLRGGRHVHQGVDVFASYGAPIRAPFAGTAVVATNDVGGLAVTVSGSDGFVYNAHLSALGRLGPVQAGTIVGYVGNSGDARATTPHDHFEWHPLGFAAVDPYWYLVQACR